MHAAILTVVLIALAGPLLATPCEERFRAGAAAYARFDAAMDTIEDGIFTGTGWASVPRVLDRLERRSALTTACQELASFRMLADSASVAMRRAAREFSLATALCFGPNQTRAQQNQETLGRNSLEFNDLSRFFNQLERACGE